MRCVGGDGAVGKSKLRPMRCRSRVARTWRQTGPVLATRQGLICPATVRRRAVLETRREGCEMRGSHPATVAPVVPSSLWMTSAAV